MRSNSCFSPSVIGLLWHVTDLDLDRLTSKCFSFWLTQWAKPLPSSSEQNQTCFLEKNQWGTLIGAKRHAKSSCLLSLVTGGACIHFGLPFWLIPPVTNTSYHFLMASLVKVSRQVGIHAALSHPWNSLLFYLVWYVSFKGIGGPLLETFDKSLVRMLLVPRPFCSLHAWITGIKRRKGRNTSREENEQNEY